MKNIIGLFILIVVVAGCSSFGRRDNVSNTATAPAKATEPAKSEAPHAASDLTQEKFEQLAVGMKYDDAVKVLGSGGSETSSSSSAGNKYVTYKWEGANNARITANFKNGVLTSKNQSNVRSGKASDSPAKADLTVAKYEQLENGISYADAVKIIGSEGEQTSSSNSGSYKSTTYRWEGDKNARFYLIFKDDKLTSKSQNNVK